VTVPLPSVAIKTRSSAKKSGGRRQRGTGKPLLTSAFRLPRVDVPKI